MNPKKELLWGLWVNPWSLGPMQDASAKSSHGPPSSGLKVQHEGLRGESLGLEP